MRFYLLSDLHLELRGGYRIILDQITKKADVAILAGDIGYHNTQLLLPFLRDMKTLFPEVIYVPGNHEYFPKMEMDKIDRELENICNHANVHFLQKNFIILNGYRFLGCTFWSPNRQPVIDLKNKMYDQTLHTSLYRSHHQWLQKQLQIKIPTVVITHHIPSFELVVPFYQNHPGLHNYYSNSDHLIGQPIQAWCFGHSHLPVRKMINGVLMISNPVGFEWDNNLVYDLGLK